VADQTAPDSWPTTEPETVVAHRDTLVGGTPPPPPTPPPADRRVGAGMLLGLGALVLVAAGILIAWLLTHQGSNHKTTTVVVTTAPSATVAPKVSVPRLIGLKEADALVRIGQVGLRPKLVYKPARAPKGVVISQKPQAGSELARDGQVTLVIDSGAPKVAVPDVTGLTLSAAQAKLDRLGLSSTTTKVTSDKPAGSIVDQAPNAGSKLPKGSTMTLSVAKGQTTTTAAAATTSAQPATTAPNTPAPAEPQNATVPDVSGQREAAAVTAFGNAGILASIVFVPGTDPLGTAVEQAKPAGTTVPFHSHVQINVSRGPNDNAPASVPNVVGQTLPQAVSTLNAAHLRLIYLKYPVTSRAQAGKVVQQSPLGSAQAPQNAQVVVYLGAFKKG
jgi:beta-lactam-binding protein with PASTA domain